MPKKEEEGKLRQVGGVIKVSVVDTRPDEKMVWRILETARENGHRIEVLSVPQVNVSLVVAIWYTAPSFYEVGVVTEVISVEGDAASYWVKTHIYPEQPIKVTLNEAVRD